MKTKPFRIIDEPIEVEFDIEPAMEKSPPCPQRFIWRGNCYTVMSVHSEHVDTTRRGRMAANMTPSHLASAARRGSWGVGQFNFTVSIDTGQIFEIYYDRAPKNVDNRKGGWFIKGERMIDRDEEQ